MLILGIAVIAILIITYYVSLHPVSVAVLLILIVGGTLPDAARL